MKRFFLFAVVALGPAAARAASYDRGGEVEFSTAPIGSPYYRHLAYDMNVDLEQLVKFEKKGFGRAEMVTIILVAKETGKPLKEYGRRRLRDNVTLEELAKEAKLDYPTLFKNAQVIKLAIEAKGADNLPPPVYITKKETDDKDLKIDEKKDDEKKNHNKKKDDDKK